jgi:tetratricopeptide (TPR) repeat protein
VNLNLSDLFRDSRWMRLGLQVGSGVIVLVIVAAAGWGWYRSQESRGLDALASATELAQEAMKPQATPEAREKAAQALEKVLADYPRFSALQQAAYELGNLKYSLGQYAAARSAYEIAATKGDSPSVRTLAAMGMGYAWEAEKNYPNAGRAYEAAAKGLHPGAFMYEEILMAEARAQDLAGNAPAALEIYQRLLREVPNGRNAEELRNRAASLKSRLGQ